MPKPVTLPRWATDLTNNDAPSSGQMDTGWTPGQTGVSDYDNYVKYWTYKWIEWLDAGNLGDMTFEDIIATTVTTSALDVTGATTYTGVANVALNADANDLDPLGTGNTTGLRTIYVTPDVGYTRSIRGLVGGVDGREIQIINASATLSFSVRNEDALATAANRFLFPASQLSAEEIDVSAGGSVTLRYVGATSRWRVISTQGCRVYCAVVIPASAAVVTGSVINNGEDIILDASGTASFPVQLPPGTVLTGYNVYANKSTGVGVTLTVTLWSRAGNAIGVLLDTSTPNSDNAPGYIVLSDTGFSATPVTISGVATSPTSMYWIRVETAGGSGDSCLHADVLCYLPI